jgi:hypothetical protein
MNMTDAPRGIAKDSYVFLAPRRRPRRVSFALDPSSYLFGCMTRTVEPGGTAILLPVTPAQWKEAVEQYGGRITIVLPPFTEAPKATPKKKKRRITPVPAATTPVSPVPPATTPLPVTPVPVPIITADIPSPEALREQYLRIFVRAKGGSP